MYHQIGSGEFGVVHLGTWTDGSVASSSEDTQFKVRQGEVSEGGGSVQEQSHSRAVWSGDQKC